MPQRRGEELAWLAGLFEGEGCIRVGGPGRPAAIRLILSMTDKDVVERVRAVAGVGKIHHKIYGYKKDAYLWTVETSADVIDLLVDMEPWFGERRRAKVSEAMTTWLHKGSAKWLDYRLLPCGTDAAYQRHYKRGEEPCEPCKEVHRVRTREQKRRARLSRVNAPTG